jgi:hypothetical protein
MTDINSKRVLVFNNYRNLGVDSPSTLILNRGIEMQDLGGRLILVGPNNAGKTNVLRALGSFHLDASGLSLKDIPNFGDQKKREPSVSLCYIDGPSYFKYTKTLSGPTSDYVPYSKEDQIKRDFDLLKKLCLKIKPFFSKQQCFPRSNKKIKTLFSDASRPKMSQKDFSVRAKSIILSLKREAQKSSMAHDLLFVSFKKKLTQEEMSAMGLDRARPSDLVLMKQTFKKKMGYNLLPNIRSFAYVPLASSALSTPVVGWQKSAFFRAFLKACGIPFSFFKINCLRKAKDDPSLFAATEELFNKKLVDVSRRFNALYHQTPNKYSFKVSFVQASINFSILVDGVARDIEDQSAGFQWFFSLYFFVLYNYDILPGDILLLDEPATTLQVNAQEELTVFLRKFAHQHELTIVMATQSPFLVESRFLDDVRLVSTNEKGEANITNLFNAVSWDKKDVLSPIANALCTRNNVVVDPEATKVFIEGLTDYSYCTAFLELFKITNLVLLPINGLGKEDDFSSTIDALLSMQRNPNILVDGDGAGVAFKAACKGRCKVRTLSELLPEDKEIEALFTPEERKLFNLLMTIVHGVGDFRACFGFGV